MELYQILGCKKESSDDEIKKNYRKLAKEFHPDKNPTAGDKFKEISFAYEVLSNPEKRQIYDRYGLKGLQEGNEGGYSNAHEFFEKFFPFSGASTSGNAGGSRARAVQVIVKVEVTLEEIYTGNVSKEFNYMRTEYCQACKGEGGPKDATEECAACNGVGRTPSYAFMGLYGLEAHCRVCSGRGKVIKEDAKCKKCAGAGIIEVEKKREIIIEKGAPNLLKIPFRSEGHQPLNGERGDLVVILIQKTHPVFVRKENDLLIRLDINITQALCGFVHCFQQLDGRSICMISKAGDVIKHGDMKKVIGEGMPLLNNPFERGDLYVEFRIEFPENNFATLAQLELLETLLPPREDFTMPDDAEEVELEDAQPNTAGAEGEDEYEDGSQFQSVQCQTG